MTFEQWWTFITESERRMLGKGYAEYIWNTAQQAVKCAKCAPEAENNFIDSKQQDFFEK